MFGEIGKWLLDISKYMITGYVLAKMFGQDDSTWVVIGAVVVAALLFVLGLYCLRKDKDKNNKKKGKYYGFWIVYYVWLFGAFGSRNIYLCQN